MRHCLIIKAEKKDLEKFKQLFHEYEVKAEIIGPQKCTRCTNLIEPAIKINTGEICVECARKILRRPDYL